MNKRDWLGRTTLHRAVLAGQVRISGENKNNADNPPNAGGGGEGPADGLHPGGGGGHQGLEGELLAGSSGGGGDQADGLVKTGRGNDEGPT